jgi:enamine deaminase RidA (YjgF/YER057c/UK114 family)
VSKKEFFSRGSGKGLAAFQTAEAKAQGLTGPVYSEGIQINASDHARFYAAGCTGTDYNTGEVAGYEPKDQALQAMKNIKIIVERADARLEDIVRLRVYLTEAAFAKMDDVMDVIDDFFPNQPLPAITVTGISKVVRDIGNLEIEADVIREKGA